MVNRRVLYDDPRFTYSESLGMNGTFGPNIRGQFNVSSGITACVGQIRIEYAVPTVGGANYARKISYKLYCANETLLTGSIPITGSGFRTITLSPKYAIVRGEFVFSDGNNIGSVRSVYFDHYQLV